ncbi:hypothetical protein [Amycolatopsis echigonensis]|uniref:Uncharacterized protein n=1 Tax=Amycolatopsis echigonensis TaxID=2576905 RepID=A0A8E1W3A8_9PSEU|nr:hypothetical protein [Amycolatopsis echigonensis]MBB2502940.1 hypothetical protein [Amycolatopsis echigonensis]
MATPRKTRTARTPKPAAVTADAAGLSGEHVPELAVPERTGAVVQAACAANVCDQVPEPGGAFCAPHVAAGWKKVEA